MKVMRRIFIDLLAIVLVLVAIIGADLCAVFATPSVPEEKRLVQLTAINILAFAASLIGGRILGRRQWYLVAIAPIMYFVYLLITIGYVKSLYIAFNMPSCIISTLCGGYIGAYIRKDDKQ